MAERGCGVPGGKGELVGLSPGDANRLAEQLHDIAAVWDLFVGLLGVSNAVQDQIKLQRDKHPRFAKICLVDGLQYWVESDPSPTVEKVIAALSSRTINNKLLAAEIGRQWGVQEEPVKENTAQPSTPGGFATRPEGLTPCDKARNNISKLQDDFISLVEHLQDHLEKTVTNAGLPKFCKEFILRMPLSVKDDNEKFFDRKSVEIYEASTFHKLFSYLNNHWSYLNHSLLGGIIKVYGSRELQHDFEFFCKCVDDFENTTTVEVFCEIEPPREIIPPLGFEQFITKHSITLKSTLKDVERIRRSFCEQFYLHEFVFHLVHIGKGSVIITWLVPHSVARLVEAEVTQELMRDLRIEDVIYADDNSENEVQPEVQAVAVALNPEVKWKGVELQGATLYGAFGDRDVLLITSEARLPEAVSHTPAPQLSEDERAGYLTSQGVPPDCPLDDLHIMKARYELNKRFEIVGVEQSTLKHPLTTSYVKSTIANMFQNIKKSGVELYYHGPGRKGTGDWCFADGFITFQDIADLYMKYFVGSVLAIHTDCSYSGSWVKSCGEFLDKQGVRPCGHSAHDKGILIKLNGSCRADEEAQSLHFSIRIMQNDKNTRTLYNKFSKAEDPQHYVFLHSTLILCDNKTIEQPCTLPPDHTWQKQLVQEANYEVKNRVYIVHCIVNGQPRWHYLLLPDNKQATAEAFFVQLRPKTRTGTLDVRDHGKVLKSGWGEEPPMEVKEWAEKDDFTKYL